MPHSEKHRVINVGKPLDTSFVPANMDCSDWNNISGYFRNLLERNINSTTDLKRWLLDRSELIAALDEEQANRYINMTCHTDDEDARNAFLYFVEEIDPRTKPQIFKLDNMFANCPFRKNLDSERYHVLDRNTTVDVKLFREQNIPLETELEQLDQKYNQICGAMTCRFDEKEQTLPQMARYLETTDRPKRENAWRAIAGRRIQDAGEINDIFDRMIKIRHEIAQNAGYNNYRDYIFPKMHRFDYGPAECHNFHNACEKVVIPLLHNLHRERTELLGVDSLRAWDLAVDVKGREPLKPFNDIDKFVNSTLNIFTKIDPGLGELFAVLKQPGCLDLESRKNKAPGGYQYERARIRMPFIFMNAAGMQRDVETLLHEGGHAFHSLLNSTEPLVSYRSPPMEFAEVASMTMELLSHPYLNEFYSPRDVDRAIRVHLEGIVATLPAVATIDAFQHWLYTNPNHTRDERNEYWASLRKRFGAAVNWDGLENLIKNEWQRILHLFGVPFYYIEYGIAQLGALQIWLKYKLNPAEAIENYKNALSVGGAKPLPELFKAAGIKFDFSIETISKLMREIQNELAKHNA